MNSVGSVFVWGRNTEGELGIRPHDNVKKEQENDLEVKNGDVEEHNHVFRNRERVCAELVPNVAANLEGKRIVRVCAGDGHSLVLDANGVVYAFGRGLEGQLGLGDKRYRYTPCKVTGGGIDQYRAVDIACGHGTSAAITSDGKLFEWGWVHYNSNPSNAQSGAPTGELVGLFDFHANMPEWKRRMLEASAREYLHGGTENARSDEGILSVGTRRRKCPIPQLCDLHEDLFITKIALGYAHTVLITCDGELWSKGYNESGGLGHGTRVNAAEYKRIMSPLLKDRTAADVACGSSHTLVACDDGKVLVWGSNGLGQLGLGTDKADSLVPVMLESLNDYHIVQVACGSYHSMAMSAEGYVFSWGHSEYGQHGGVGADQFHRPGDLSRMYRHFYVPRPLEPFCHADAHDRVVQATHIACGSQYNLVLDKDGAVWSFGWNGYGVLGHGSRVVDSMPRRIEALEGVVVNHMSPGPRHVLIHVPSLGNPHALLFAKLNSIRPCIELYDARLVSTEPKWWSKDKDGVPTKTREPPSVEAHCCIIFSRCPELVQYVQHEKDAKGKTVVQLPLVVELPVLKAFREYLYSDHAHSCPPHRLVNLSSLANLLNLPRLDAICQYNRASRMRQQGLTTSLAKLNYKTMQEIPPSGFQQDMLKMYESATYADINLRPNHDDRSNPPIGHTEFSWNGDHTNQVPIGHTSFSTGLSIHPAHAPILCRYKYFENLLVSEHEFKENKQAAQQQGISLHDVDAPTLDSMLRFIYSGDRSVVDQNAVISLLAAALCYGIDDLANLCEQYLFDHADEANAETILEFAQSFFLKRLETKASRILARSQ